MTGPLRELWERVLGFARGRRADRDLEAELEAHIEMAMEDHLRRGMSPQDARRLAEMKFGTRLLAHELAGDQRGLPWLDGIFQDVRYAVRGLRRSSGFTLTAIAMLALAIGLNVTVFTVMETVLFRGFPLVTRSDRVVYMQEERDGEPLFGVSYPNFQDWSRQASSFEGMAIVRGGRVTLSDEGRPIERCRAVQVSANAFRLTGQQPILGRDFAPSDERPGAARVVILNYAFWERRYGKDPAVVGSTVRINREPATVIGVMPPGFSFPNDLELWMPLAPTPEMQDRGRRSAWMVMGRMAEGVTMESARAEMDAIARRLASAYPQTNRGIAPGLQGFTEFFIGPDANVIYRSMWGAAGLVLLIACANLANLTLARAIGRSRELSVRIALGAGRWRMMRQLLTESVMLSAAGGVLGWWIAQWSVRTYALATASQYQVLDYTMDSGTLGYLVAISMGAGILFGLAPIARLRKLPVSQTLKDGGRGVAGFLAGKRLSALLVTGQMALAVMLLSAAGVMVRSFLKFYTADVGVKTENVLLVGMGFPGESFPTAESRVQFLDRVKMRIEAIPGVASATMARRPPAQGVTPVPFELESARPGSGSDGDGPPSAPMLVIGSQYFSVLGATVYSGREFNDGDGVSAMPVAIVNQRFAARYWPGEDPVGKRLRLMSDTAAPQPGEQEAWRTVVGVVSDILQYDITRQRFEPVVYVPYRQREFEEMVVLARTQVPPASLAPAVRREMQALDPELHTWWDTTTLDESLEFSSERMDIYHRDTGKNAVLFPIFAAIALLLASVGLYAVIAHSVSRRTQEIGVRMAVGATAGDIQELVLRQGMRPVGIGLILGLAASLAVTRLLESQLVGVSPYDPLTLAVSSAALIAAALLGCQIPARRATRVDPVVALRQE